MEQKNRNDDVFRELNEGSRRQPVYLGLILGLMLGFEDSVRGKSTGFRWTKARNHSVERLDLRDLKKWRLGR